MLKISFIIPVLNEKKTVVKAINQIINLKFKKKEIIIIDNGSIDGSQELIKKFYKKKNIRIILRKKNLGYGASIKEGARLAKGKYIYIHFSDAEYDHKTSLKMYNLAEKYKADAVFGSRLKNMTLLNKIFAIKKKPAYLATILITFLYNLFYNKKFTDVIGSKFYKTNIFKKIKLKQNYLNWDFELKNRLISNEYKIFEIFTKYKPRLDESRSVKYYHMFPILYSMIKFKLMDSLRRS